MRIDRIKSNRITGLGTVDWAFPVGSVVLFCEDRSHLRKPEKLLSDLFYDLNTTHLDKVESNQGLLEVWVTGENTRFHIHRGTIHQGIEMVSSTLVTDEGTGQTVSVPNNQNLGDYLLRINRRAFRQGVFVNWPEKDDCDSLSLRVNNLRQGGDEGLSLTKVRASLAGAQKRVSDQKGSMVLVKAEYDALRQEWEAAHRQQDEERLLLIEIKNLQEKEAILSEKIASAKITEERLALLTQNPDYRELRQLQGEIIQLEERIQATESNLTTLTNESVVDWAMIENLRGECLEWASFQKQVEDLGIVAQRRAEINAQLKGSLKTCGYNGLSNDEDQRLRRAEEARAKAQEELNKLKITKDELERTRLLYLEERARLQDLEDMAGVTEADEVKIVQREKHLKQWRGSKICCSLDRALRKHLSGISIGEKLEDGLGHFYGGYHASNFEEFTSRLKDFRDQQKLVERVQIHIERLQEKADREAMLRRIVLSRTELLKQAFLATKSNGLSAWLNGWENYQVNKHQLALKVDELQLILEQIAMDEKKLQSCADQLREKLGDWDTPARDREEVLGAVFKVASQLRAKDEAEREIAEYSKRFTDLLGDRNMERLAEKLEPLADLERESRIFADERLTELNAWQNERQETRKQRTEAEKRLKDSGKFQSMIVLEKKIETVKRQWQTYEDLHRAIADAQALLEMSWQEWQTKFGKVLNSEKTWIMSKISSSLDLELIHSSKATEAKRNYFAYRMAIAQLSLGSYFEAPLFFTVGDVDENERFWVDSLEYFRKLSLKRQIILITTDAKLREKLIGISWSSVNVS